MGHQQQSVIKSTTLRSSPPTPIEPRCSMSPCPTYVPSTSGSIDARHRSTAISIPNPRPTSYPRLGQLLSSPSSASSASSLSSLTSPFASVSLSPRYSQQPKFPSLHQILADTDDDMDAVPTQSEPLYYNRSNQSKSSLSPPGPYFHGSPLLGGGKMQQHSPNNLQYHGPGVHTSPHVASRVYSPHATRAMSTAEHHAYMPPLVRKRVPYRTHSSDGEDHHGKESGGEQNDDADEDGRAVIRRRSSSSTMAWQRIKPVQGATREKDSVRSTLSPSLITKPRWQDVERQHLFEAIVKDKQLDDMSTYRWDKIAELVGRPKKACKDQWRREVLPALRRNLKVASNFQQELDMSDSEE